MKIELEIDDRFGESRLLILAGVELVASKNPWDSFWKVKTVSCNRCGECCMGNPSTIYGDDEEGNCKALIKQSDGTWECGAGQNRPWRCLDDPRDIPCCSIRHKVVKVS